MNVNTAAVNLIKRFLDFILFGNIFVALGGFCLVQSTRIQVYQNDNLLAYSLLVFFATIFVYNFQRVFYKPMEDISLHSIRRKWIFRNQITIKILTVIGFAGVAISFSFNDPMIVFYLSPLLIISIAYFASFIKLRKNPWFKLFALVIVWTTATAVVPILLVSDTFFSTENMLHILVRFCFMMAICIPFDIRDLKIDKADDVSTLPHVIGEGGSRWVAIMFMFAYILLIFPEYKLEMFTATVFYALLLSALINTVLVFMSSSRRSEYFYVAGLDGTMILQGVLLLIASAETF